jgi:hypothetical protein
MAAQWLRNNQMQAGVWSDRLAKAIEKQDVAQVFAIMARLGAGATAGSPAAAAAVPTRLSASEPNDSAFRQWYAGMSKRHGLDPNPEGQFYDYRAAFKAGAEPDSVGGHWPSQFKQAGHPNEVVGGFNTRTGERVPGTRQASEVELVRLGWDPVTAKQLSRGGAGGRP